MEHFLELKRKLALTLSLAIAFALLVAFVINYSVSKVSIIDGLVNKQLPLTATTISSDLRNQSLGLFINPNPSAYQKQYLSEINYGLDQGRLNQMLELYQKEYGHNVYLVNNKWQIVAHNSQSVVSGKKNLHDINAFHELTQTLNKKQASFFELEYRGDTYLINARYLPELDWYLFVDSSANKATANIRQAFYLNLCIGLFATLTIFWLTNIAIGRYQWQIKQKLSDMSSSDSLTGLANRYTFDILIGHVLANAKRNQAPVSLVLLDIDLMKSAIMEHGHVVTDQLIQGVGQLIKTSIRASDVGCRWNEDTFLVTLNNCLPEKATRIAESLRLSISEYLTTHAQTMNLSVSAGVTNYHVNDTVDTLIERIERALVHAQSQDNHKVMYVQAPYYTPTYMTRRLNNPTGDVKAVQMQA